MKPWPARLSKLRVDPGQEATHNTYSYHGLAGTKNAYGAWHAWRGRPGLELWKPASPPGAVPVPTAGQLYYMAHPHDGAVFP